VTISYAGEAGLTRVFGQKVHRPQVTLTERSAHRSQMRRAAVALSVCIICSYVCVASKARGLPLGWPPGGGSGDAGWARIERSELVCEQYLRVMDVAGGRSVAVVRLLTI